MRISSFSLLLLASLASSSSVVGQGLRGGLAKPLMKLDGHAEADQDLTVRRLGKNCSGAKKKNCKGKGQEDDADGSTDTDTSPDADNSPDSVDKKLKKSVFRSAFESISRMSPSDDSLEDARKKKKRKNVPPPPPQKKRNPRPDTPDRKNKPKKRNPRPEAPARNNRPDRRNPDRRNPRPEAPPRKKRPKKKKNNLPDIPPPPKAPWVKPPKAPLTQQRKDDIIKYRQKRLQGQGHTASQQNLKKKRTHQDDTPGFKGLDNGDINKEQRIKKRHHEMAEWKKEFFSEYNVPEKVQLAVKKMDIIPVVKAEMEKSLKEMGFVVKVPVEPEKPKKPEPLYTEGTKHLGEPDQKEDKDGGLSKKKNFGADEDGIYETAPWGESKEPSPADGSEKQKEEKEKISDSSGNNGGKIVKEDEELKEEREKLMEFYKRDQERIKQAHGDYDPNTENIEGPAKNP